MQWEGRRTGEARRIEALGWQSLVFNVHTSSNNPPPLLNVKMACIALVMYMSLFVYRLEGQAQSIIYPKPPSNSLVCSTTE